MLRVLIADDQIPDETVAPEDIKKWASEQYPNEPDNSGFIAAFGVMRKAVDTLRDGCNLNAVRRFAEAQSLIRSEHFDVAIIDLGWAGDKSVSRAQERTAGWQLVEMIEEEDSKHPKRPPTAQIIYSSRFETDPALGHEAAQRGIMPFYKPYGERHSLPLGNEAEKVISSEERVRIACESLRAVVKFIEGLQRRKLERVVQSAQRALDNAHERAHRWDTMSLILTILGVLVLFAGIIMMFFGSTPQGAISTASGAVVAVFPRMLYRRVDATYRLAGQAQTELVNALKGAE
jgi:Cyanobacterial TRADD-N associated 2-Transmembrane domain